MTWWMWAILAGNVALLIGRECYGRGYRKRDSEAFDERMAAMKARLEKTK